MKRYIQSLLCAGLAIIIFNVIYFIGRGLMYLLDKIRGLDGDLIQGIGMEIIIPHIGGYLAASTSRQRFDNSIPKANMIFYSIMFLFVFFLVYVNLTPFYFKNSDGIRQFLLWVLPFAGIIGGLLGFLKNKITFGQA
ncbi:MAG TPA: hypothetical protein VF622_19485 [Segetibacter sp.]|jgi:hypothetical protein